MSNFKVILISFLFLPFYLKAQIPDTIFAKPYLDSIHLLAISQDYPNAYTYCEKVIKVFSQSGRDLDTLLAYSFYEIGVILKKKSQLNEALFFQKKALQIRLSYFGNEHYLTAKCHSQIAVILELQGKYDLALDHSRKVLEIIRTQFGNENSKMIGSLNNLGVLYRKRGNYTKALKLYHEALKICQKTLGSKHKFAAVLYNNIGSVHRESGKYEEALNFFSKALELKKEIHGSESLIITSTYHNIAAAYSDKREYDKALEFHQKSLYIRLMESHRPGIATSYNDIGLIYKNKKEYDKALEYLHNSLKIRLEVFKDHDHPEITKTYNNIGWVYTLKKKYNEAFDFYQKALDIRLRRYNDHQLEIADSYRYLGVLFQKKEEYDKAAEYFTKSLNIILNSQGSDSPALADVYKNIGINYDKIGERQLAIEYFKKTLVLQLEVFGTEHPDVASTYHKIGTIYYKNKEYGKAMANYENSIQSLDRMKKIYTSERSKQFHLSDQFSIFEDVIKVCKTAAITNPHEFNLELAFEYSEKSKSNFLQEALNKIQAETYAGLPESLLQKETDFKVDLAYFEKKIFEELSKGILKEDSIIHKYNSKLFDVKQQYYELIDQLEKDYPDYHDLKYRPDVASVEQVQKELLNSEAVLLEYFVGDSLIYVFLIASDDYQAHQINIDFPLETWVSQMRKGMYEYQLSGSSDESSYKAFSDTFAMASFQLYQKLIAPFKKDLPEKLIIIPDGILNYIPFEVLLMKAPEESHRFKNHAYLIRDHQISYSYSATFLHELKQKKNKASKGLLAFAPSFNSGEQMIAGVEARRAELGPLQFSIPEVENINSLLGGEIYLGNEATEDNFIRLAGDYQILHLATHGKANDKAGDYCFLAFTEVEDSIENEFLYVRDLYNLKLEADMVVLSACETGLGELQRGEGVVSLARGFAYAGAKSIITTLWSVSDEKTKDLMIPFYENIKAGMTKDAALRKAKLDYIDLHSHQDAHPFFWAGLIPLGDMEPIKTIHPLAGFIKYGLLAIGFMLFSIWLFKRNKLST